MIDSSVFKNFKQVEYKGVTITKEKFGQIPVFHYNYYFKTTAGRLIKYNLYLRVDPRENDVPIEGNSIRLTGDKTTYITIDATELNKCDKSILAVAKISGFLTDNQIKIKSGTTDINEAAVYGNDSIDDYITCENKPDNTVIEFEKGDKTRVSIEGNCHKIIFGPECKVLEAAEKYNVQAILNSKK